MVRIFKVSDSDVLICEQSFCCASSPMSSAYAQRLVSEIVDVLYTKNGIDSSLCTTLYTVYSVVYSV